MKAAILNGNVIENIVVTSSLDVLPDLKWLSNKSTLSIGDEYVEEMAYCGEIPPIPIVEIIIDNVTERLLGFEELPNEYTLAENSTSVATGTGLTAYAGKKFRVPFVRVDTGREILREGVIDANGDFTISLNFPTSGTWIVNSELLNSQLQVKAFSIEPHKFKVM